MISWRRMFSEQATSRCLLPTSSALISSMLTRLRVRPLASVGLAGTRGRLARSYSSDYSEKPAEPFKILFCGSDEFSTAALAAVLEAEGE